MATPSTSPPLPSHPQNSPEIPSTPILIGDLKSFPSEADFSKLTFSPILCSSSVSISSSPKEMSAFDINRKRFSGNRSVTNSSTGSRAGSAGPRSMDGQGNNNPIVPTNAWYSVGIPGSVPIGLVAPTYTQGPSYAEALHNTGGHSTWEPNGIDPANLHPSLSTLPEGMRPTDVIHRITAEQLYNGYSYAYARPDGSFTRLIPADEISPIKDIPHTQGPDGLIVLPEPSGISPKTSRQLMIARSTTGPNRRNSTEVYSEPVQGRIDSIVSHHVTPKPSGKPTKREKIYCDMWIHKGLCAFTQQGCKYKHEMPTDKATQVSLGLFHGLPDWFKRAQGVELNPAGAFPRSRGRGQSVSQGPKYIEEGRADSRNTSKIRGNGGNSACRGDLGGRRVEEYLQPFPAPASPPSVFDSPAHRHESNARPIDRRYTFQKEDNMTASNRSLAQSNTRTHRTSFGSMGGLGAGFTGRSAGVGNITAYHPALGGGVTLKSSNPYDMLYAYEDDCENEN